MRLTRTPFAVLLAIASCAGLGLGGNNAALIEAAKTGNGKAVQALIKQHADVNTREADGTTALHWAARANDVDTSRALLRAGARADQANRYGVTPLSLAASNGSAAMIEMLLKAGADPNSSLPEGETVLMTAARTGSVEALKLLLAAGADVHARESWVGETALMWAAMENHPEATKLLVESGAEVNARSRSSEIPRLPYPRVGLITMTFPRGGWTPLMYAAREGARDAVRALADCGADLNLADPEGTTALMLAVINANYEVAAALLEKGANPNLADASGMTALYAAVDMHTLAWMQGRPAPRITGELNELDIVGMLLARGADPNASLRAPTLQRQHTVGDASLAAGTTPLMRAAKTGDVKMLRILLEHGADPMLRQRNSTTALMIGTGLGLRNDEDGRDLVTDADLIGGLTLLLTAGMDVNATNDQGQTALHLAAARGADVIVRFLAEQGAKLDAKDRQGLTPLDVALGRGVGGRGGRGGVVRQSTATLLRQLAGGTGAKPDDPVRKADDPIRKADGRAR
jgi:ankyrin repeat protein